MIKKFITGTIISQLILSLIWISIYPKQAISFIFGSGLSLANFLVLSFVWFFIFYKKRVAPSFSVVVIKYGILVLIFSKIPEWHDVDQNHFVFGVILNPISVFFGGLIAKVSAQTEKGS